MTQCIALLLSNCRANVCDDLLLLLYSRENASPTHTLSFTIEFPYENDTVYLAYCYPYTYSQLQDRLLLIQVIGLTNLI